MGESNLSASAIAKRKSAWREILAFFMSAFFLLCGGLIYLEFRPHSLMMFSWLRALDLEQFFSQKVFNENSALAAFCVFSLPNGLWALSAIILFGQIWRDSKKTFLFYAVTFTAGNILFEFLQLFRVIRGTFDFADLLVLVISFIGGILIYKCLLSKKR